MNRVRALLRGGLIGVASVAVLAGLAIGAVWLFRTVIFDDVVGRFEALRVPCPDQVLDAVVFASSVAATSSFGYDLHIVPAGTDPAVNELPVARLRAPFRAGGTEYGTSGIDLHWPDNASVLVEYLRADEVSIAPTEPVVVEGRSVWVELVDGVTRSAAAAPSAEQGVGSDSGEESP